MLSDFKEHIKSSFPVLIEQRIGVAISGGVDSVVLAHLLQQCGAHISLLHCNFMLRGAASDGDQSFVKRLAESLKVPFYTIEFNTENYAEAHKMSIQVAARELRYRWFKQIATLHDLDVVVTAHHNDDNLETFMINLTRGTGLDGLTGIPKVNDLFVRPLLPFSKQEIINYAEVNQFDWREDASNAETKYLRNKIRHEIIPVLKDLNTDVLENFNTTIHFLQRSQAYIKDKIQQFRDLYFLYDPLTKGYKISIEALKKEGFLDIVLFEVLKEYGFTAWGDIHQLLMAQSGKKIFSPTYTLLKDRTDLLLFPSVQESVAIMEITANDIEVVLPSGILKFQEENTQKEAISKQSIVVDKNKLKFPVHVRSWEIGDYFYPSGMKGKKKVGKYFKDEKFSLPQKEKTLLLCSDDEIVWIIGHRADQRFIATTETKHAVQITFKSIL